MLLNRTQIEKKELLKRTKEKKFFSAGYNLTVNKIITMDGEEHEQFNIPRRGLVQIVSNEIFNLPKNIIGYTTVKNELSRNGILAINIGIVDEGWNQPISSVLINFGKSDYLISKDDAFLRMTFHDFEPNRNDEKAENINCEKFENDDEAFNEYIKSRKKEATRLLSDTFLTIDEIQNEIRNSVLNDVKKSIIKTITFSASIVVILSLLINTFLWFLDHRPFYKEKRIQGKQVYENKSQIDSLKIDFNDFKNTFEYNTQGGDSK